MSGVPTPEELRYKAVETRAEAEAFATQELRMQMFKIAAEYERLATRAEEYGERARRGLATPHVIENWFG